MANLINDEIFIRIVFLIGGAIAAGPVGYYFGLKQIDYSRRKEQEKINGNILVELKHWQENVSKSYHDIINHINTSGGYTASIYESMKHFIKDFTHPKVDELEPKATELLKETKKIIYKTRKSYYQDNHSVSDDIQRLTQQQYDFNQASEKLIKYLEQKV